MKAPYPFCWWCSRKLWNRRSKAVEVIGGTVWVHAWCVEECRQ